jgi:hypothetical protein
LVVGDWFVDEHWVTGVHRSPTASRPGRRHARALHGLDSNVESLCGAGRVASVLHQAVLDDKPYFHITGVGAWHPDDEDTLKSMLDPAAGEGQTPHRLTRRTVGTNDRVQLFNLAEALTVSGTGTTRIIRIYEQEGSEFALIHRLDWKPRSRALRAAWNPSRLKALEVLIEEHLPDAVLLKDLGYGGVFPELLQWLTMKVGGVPWFVSSKVLWEPDLLDNLPKQTVKLVLVPQVAAFTAAAKKEVHTWITSNGYVTKSALAAMDGLGAQFSNALVVALPNGMSLVAREAREPDRHGLLQTETGVTKLAGSVPMASVFFPALVARLLTVDSGHGEQGVTALKAALSFTAAWMTSERKRIDEPETWKPQPDQILRLNNLPPNPDWQRWKPFSWSHAVDSWEAAFSTYGIINRSKHGSPTVKQIHLWRSMTEVDDYVCCLKSKRIIMQEVIGELIEAKRAGQSRSFMFVASPGSGKTFLMSRLARALGMTFLPFNITQLLYRQNLIDCFDTIATTQAQNSDQMVLAFFDEINADLESAPVFDAFLAPIEAGQYMRAGKTFHIRPCVWVFAGTEHGPAATNTSPNSGVQSTQKWSDFQSRLSHEPYRFKVDHDDATQVEEAQLEKVYLGVSLLRVAFPDVRKVTEKVLRAFDALPVHVGARDVEKFVRSFRYIQEGVVTSLNLPEGWRTSYKTTVEEKAWALVPEGDEIEIIR